jgi:hypothetical protein
VRLTQLHPADAAPLNAAGLWRACRWLRLAGAQVAEAELAEKERAGRALGRENAALREQLEALQRDAARDAARVRELEAARSREASRHAVVGPALMRREPPSQDSGLRSCPRPRSPSMRRPFGW